MPRAQAPSALVIQARPLAGLELLSVLACLSRAKALELIETGELFPVFNVAPKSSRNRPLLRLPTSLILSYADTGKPPKPLDPAAWLATLLPAGPDPSAARVAELLGVSPEHCIKLIREKLLLLAPGANIKRGPAGSPKVSAASLRAFLAARVLS
jgi:hypothetical protein